MGFLPAFQPGVTWPINHTTFGYKRYANLRPCNAAPPRLGRGLLFAGDALRLAGLHFWDLTASLP